MTPAPATAGGRPPPFTAREAEVWRIIAAAAALAAGWFAFTPMSFAAGSALAPAGACGGLVLLGLWYRLRRGEAAIAAALLALAQLVAFTAVGSVLSYLTASLGLPFWDETLHAWDRALGLDWRAYLAFVNARPALGDALRLAYGSILPQMAIVVAALAFTGRARELDRFVFAAVVVGLLTAVMSGAMPAMAMFVHAGLGPADYPNLSPAAAHVHVAAMEGLRSGATTVVSLRGAEGIVTFPSYHAALAVIFAASFWAVPVLRWPGLALNAAMLAATPIDGGHYFVDVLAGAALAALALAAGSRAAPRVFPAREGRSFAALRMS